MAERLDERAPDQRDRLEDLGEFGLIARLTRGLPGRVDVVLPAGDDAALLNLGGGEDVLLAATCDAQVEGRHFMRGVATPEEIGWKALAVNLSDIAAMGGEPLWALVSLLLSAGESVTALDGVYAGLRALAGRYGVAIVGGNIAGTSGPLTIDITLLGRVARPRALTRAGGRPSDALLVTGTLGGAAAGVLLATGTTSHGAARAGIAPELAKRAHDAMAAPEPRVAEGRALAASGVVTAMLDVSDGFAADLGHLCAASGVGALVEEAALPIAPAAVVVAPVYGRAPLDLALYGGEDYELLLSVRPEGVRAAVEAVRGAGGSARVIGRLTADAGRIESEAPSGERRQIEPRGWDHLRYLGV